MAKEYANALFQMKITNVTVIGRNKQNLKIFSDKFNYKTKHGNISKIIKIFPKVDLVIIATSIETMIPFARILLNNNQTNLLIEKPGTLFFREFKQLKTKKARIRIAYNRITYPNFHKLKTMIREDGGITSANFTFTEKSDMIDFKKDNKIVYKRWGISNSLHVISTVFELIGLPKKISPYIIGKLNWHPSGSIFVGSGISKKNIPFSYHANWESAGRWGIEIMTKSNAYRLISLEEIHLCKKNSFVWTKVNFTKAYPSVKQGIAEEVAVMLDSKLEKYVPLVTLEKAVQFNKIAEKILGYKN